jgi:hypothetical protein
MKRELPAMLTAAMADGTWKDPGADLLRTLLGVEIPESEILQLYPDVAYMERVANALDTAGYIDYLWSCMVRSSTATADNDPRLVFDQALFIGGSRHPGDDVYIAINLGNADSDPTIYTYDWEKEVPNRWVAGSTLSQLIQGLASKVPN